MEVTDPLPNCACIPSYPSTTTARKIVELGVVRDADDGTLLTAGLHRNEIACLMAGTRILPDCYRYVILNGHIYHTRAQVIIEVECEDA